LPSLKSLASIAIIVLFTKAKQILLRADALCLLVSKWLLKAIAVLGLRRPSNIFYWQVTLKPPCGGFFIHKKFLESQLGCTSFFVSECRASLEVWLKVNKS
jgi:hypothetical protein